MTIIDGKHVAETMREELKKRVSDRTFIIICCIYAILVFALFLLFYPVLSGQPVAVDFVIKYLRWQDTWVLISG